jgi:uncharacterized repeat protein (TIGR02543 family)
MNAAISVTATFVNNRLTVVRTGDGRGSVTSSPSGINCGGNCTEDFNNNTSVTLTASASSGSRFAGWSGGGCTGTGTCAVTMTGPITVSAQFVEVFTLTVTKPGTGSGTVTSSIGGINCGATCTASLDSGATVSLTAAPDPGSVFVGWTGDCTGNTTCSVTMSQARTVGATFTPAFALTVSRAGLGTGTVTSSPVGINCGTDCVETYLVNTGVTLTASAGTNSVFTGWSGGGCSGTGACVVTMDAAKTVTATFAPTFALTVVRAGSGSGTVVSDPVGISCGTDCTESYESGTMVMLTGAAEIGSTFGGWSGGGCSGTGSCTVTMDAAKSVTATFD